MRVFHPYGSKERLFEMVKRVNRLDEQILPIEKKKEIVKELIKFVDERIGMDGDVPDIELSYDENEARNMRAFGKYVPETNHLRVVAINRNFADVLRTAVHEMIHHKQNKDGVLDKDSNETGSKYENEANALAGVIMREFGQKYPMIFE